MTLAFFDSLDPMTGMQCISISVTFFFCLFFGKSDKKSERTASFLEKMKKIFRKAEKIEKNLDIVFAKCYNMLYC